MRILVVRHGLSEANDINLPAFGKSDAKLLPRGIEQAEEVGKILVARYGIDPKTEPVAASDMFRSQQTASVAGFIVVRNYPILNEVDIPDKLRLREALDNKKILPEAYKAAEAVLASPPAERIWFTHGYLIAALCKLTGFDLGDERPVPRFGEARELVF
jgi:hypothetical protein